MKVSDLAKELNVSSSDILTKMKALKFKAKDSDQELNTVVITVLSSELGKGRKAGGASAAAVAVKEAPAKAKAAEAPKETKMAKVEPKAPAKAEPKVEAKAKAKASKEEAKKAKEVKPKKDLVKKVEKEKTPPAPIAKEEKKPTPPVNSKEAEKPVAIIKELPKTKVSSEPFVSVKPLVKKKRKTFGRHEFTAPAGEAGARPETLPAEHPPTGGEQPTAADEAVAPVLKPLEVQVPISVKDFAIKVQSKTNLILKQMMQMGILATINQNLGEDIVKKLARELGYDAHVTTPEQQLIEVHEAEKDDPALLKPRAPVITFMGHVDHGKTSLLDKIRKSKVADEEHGGITQHIGAYSVQLPKGKITFLGTPGHEAFTAMRARGAHITDIVILVVAADEGIMPQTIEAIDHARAAEVPIVVALNKIDRRNADVDRVKKQLAEHGLNHEDWGGKTIVIGVSAVTGEGIDALLEMILLESELLELKANYEKRASGIVIDAHMSQGKGAVATLIVQSGILKIGDIVVVGPHYGKVKAMFDDRERPIAEAGPSTPIEILGLPAAPEAGEIFYVFTDERTAKEITESRREQIKTAKLRSNLRITLEDLYSHIQEGKIKELNVIIKADVQGSLEALKDSLEKIPSEEVKIKIIHMNVGDINASDVILAMA